ncbi:MAG TPA: hypothetical protein VF789_18000 [Thermoanaerobaculia bacterium]
MRERICTALGLVVILLLCTSQEAFASCQRCRNGGTICSADHCEFVMVCDSASFNQYSKVGCETDASGNCNLSGETCFWAFHNNPPACLEEKIDEAQS